MARDMAVLKRLRWLVLGGQVLAGWSPEAYSLYGFISLWEGGREEGSWLYSIYVSWPSIYTQYLPPLHLWYLINISIERHTLR
jgi:hypothetical protein